jgi:uncharacterized protein (TIGR03437 family)
MMGAGYSPAHPGEAVSMFATGFGLPATPLVEGQATQTGQLAVAPTIWIGGTQSDVTFAGVVAPGLYQINVKIPASASDGDNAVIASDGGVYTPLATVFVKR